ncbi:MAG: UvrD-helicase domain-containing protein [Candidatus Colwellbacteria bacterium]|nr:UvrD-helicase domain-containing protein [Candidatus Colwellbacteria bacterium]
MDGKRPLNPGQSEAVAYGKGPLIIVAGAGSGKTRTLTERLVHLVEAGVRPERIVAITFTNKAANEMRARLDRPLAVSYGLRARSPFVGTFHSFGAKILREEAKHFGRSKNFAIFDNKDSERLMKNILNSSSFGPAKMLWEISRLKNNLLLEKELEPKFLRFFKAYESGLRRQNAFDFDDLIEKPVQLFQKELAILEKHQKRYDYILVDEYQDINTAQYLLLKQLCQNHRNLNVVGDDEQAIYGWRWSDFKNFLNFERDWPEAKVVTLGENYRSTGIIVEAAAALIENNQFRRPKKLWTSNGRGELIKVINARDPEEEAKRIVAEIMSRGRTESAILYRTNAQSRALEQELNFNFISYEIFGGVKFYERKEIKDIISGLRYALNPKDEISRERLEKTFTKRVAAELISELPRLAGELKLLELIGFILKTANYSAYLEAKFRNAEERQENVAELISFAAGFHDLGEFIEKISLLQPLDKTILVGEDKPIKLMTIHLAKGLEFENVYVVGAAEGFLPHNRSLGSDEELEEERRLMYVAMTRAKQKLVLSFHGMASRFLYELPPELVEFSPTTNLDSEEEIFLD